MSVGRATDRARVDQDASGCEAHLHDGLGLTVTGGLILVGVTLMLVWLTGVMAPDLGWERFTPWVRGAWVVSIPPTMVVARVVQTRRAGSTTTPAIWGGAGAGGMGVGAYGLVPDRIGYLCLVAFLPFYVGFMLEYYVFQAQLTWDEHHPLPAEPPEPLA